MTNIIYNIQLTQKTILNQIPTINHREWLMIWIVFSVEEVDFIKIKDIMNNIIYIYIYMEILETYYMLKEKCHKIETLNKITTLNMH